MKIKFTRIISNKSQLNWDWSGSINSLKKALQDKVFLEEDFIYYDWKMNLNKLLIRLGLKKDDLNVYNIKRASQILKKSNVPIITFDEFPNGKFSYIYQDLIIHYLIHISKFDKDLFNNSGFSSVSKEILEKRLIMQEQFYQSGANVLTMSHWLKKYIVENNILPSERVFYVGAGINIEQDKIDKSKKEGNRFLFIGKDFERKAGDMVVKAFNILKKDFQHIELYIIGPETISSDYLGEGIHFLGELDIEQVSDYLNLCDYFVMPSFFEAFGLVFIEALSYGLPCIGRNIHEMPYLIDDGETGFLLDKDETNPVVLSQLMKKMYLNDNLVKNVVANKEFYRCYYSWDTVANRFISVIDNSKQ